MAERTAGRSPRDTPTGIVSALAQKLGELESSVGRQAERFRAVLEIGIAISSARDVDGLLRLVMDKLTSLLAAEASTLFMVDEERRELWSRVLKGSTLKEIRMPLDAGIAGSVLTTGKTLLLGDAYDDVRFNPDIDRQSGFRTRSMIATPLRHVSGRVLGVVQVLHRKVDAFTAEDRDLVEAVASQIASVLDHVLLLEQLRLQNEKLRKASEALSQAVQDLDVLYELERAISGTDDTEDLVDRILGKAIAVSGAKAGSILLAEDERDALFFRAAQGARSEALISMSLEAGQGIAGRVATTGVPIRVASAEESPHYDRSVARKLAIEIGAVLCVPIVGDGKVLGALELLNKAGGFSEADERLATLLAGQTGRAVLLKRSREAGERKARLAAIGQMLSAVLHDLKTPMTVISGYAELMGVENDPVERQAAAAIILQQLDHLNSMTRETLAFARGDTDVLLRKIYLQEFIKELRVQLGQEFKKTKVELKLVAEFTGALRADESKLRRLIFNLARNAIEAMPSGGRFTVSFLREQEHLLLKFQDNGPGIPPAILDRLFESFVTAGKKNGTGLGLAIVKTIAVEHGGSVEVKSRPGKGTTFEVRLPLEGPQAAG